MGGGVQACGSFRELCVRRGDVNGLRHARVTETHEISITIGRRSVARFNCLTEEG